MKNGIANKITFRANPCDFELIMARLYKVTAPPWPQKQHGLFTFNLCGKMN